MQNVNNFHFEEKSGKKALFFYFFKGHYFIMGGPIDINVDVF